MLNRLSLVLAVSVIISMPRIVGANPITYDFTGAFKYPVDGTNTISGSLTINATPPMGAGALSVTEDGSDVSLTLNLAGQVLNFVNTPQRPDNVQFIEDVLHPPVQGSSNGQATAFDFGAMTGPAFTGSGSGPNVSFGLTIYTYGIGAIPANLATLPISPFASSFGLLLNPLMTEGGGGALTSIEIVSTPEPSTLAVFAVLGAAALLRRRGTGQATPPASDVLVSK